MILVIFAHMHRNSYTRQSVLIFPTKDAAVLLGLVKGLTANCSLNITGETPTTRIQALFKKKIRKAMNVNKTALSKASVLKSD